MHNEQTPESGQTPESSKLQTNTQNSKIKPWHILATGFAGSLVIGIPALLVFSPCSPISLAIQAQVQSWGFNIEYRVERACGTNLSHEAQQQGDSKP
jgi:hypothetical protein